MESWVKLIKMEMAKLPRDRLSSIKYCYLTFNNIKKAGEQVLRL